MRKIAMAAYGYSLRTCSSFSLNPPPDLLLPSASTFQKLFSALERFQLCEQRRDEKQGFR